MQCGPTMAMLYMQEIVEVVAAAVQRSCWTCDSSFHCVCQALLYCSATSVASSFSSASYILKVPFENTGGAGIVYVWVGSKTSQEEQIHAEQMGRTMFGVSVLRMG